MLACDWNGHSYSASTIRAAPAKAGSISPTVTGTSRFTTGAWRMWSYSAATSGKGAATSDQVTCSRSAACTASHSRSATIPMKPLSRTTRMPGMSFTGPSSTATGTAPATGGRIMRPCSIPGTLMSVT
jgi:hypothetical protein